MQTIPHGIERFGSDRFTAFRKTFVHEATGTPAELEADLAVLRAFGPRAKLRRVALLVMALLVAGVAALAASEARGDDQPIIAAMGAFVFVVLMFMRMRQPKHIEQRRIELASGLLRQIQVGPQPGRLKLDLASIMVRRKKAGKENGFDVYNDPFLELEVSLPDGTHVKLERTEQLQYYEMRTAKRRVREWKGTEWDTITIRVPSATGGDYRDRAQRDLSHVSSSALTLARGFEPVSFEARADQVRVVVRNQLLWDASADGAQLRPKRDDAVQTISLWLQQLGAAARLNLMAQPPQEAWKATLPVIGLRGGIIVLALCAMAGFGLVIVSGSEMPKHYGYIDTYGSRAFEEDVMRTGAFGLVCCALPLAGCFGLVALARKRRRAYESG